MAELKTFLFTDICGSVRLKNEMTGRSVSERDLAFIHSILTPHRQRIESQLAEFGGRVVSTAGDGHFLVFDHTVQAAQWAVAVQESHRDEPILAPGDIPVEVRISIHSGVPQVDPNDLTNFVGKSVDYASRLNDYATGGQILISRSVMAILDDVGLEGLRLHLHGRRNLKGIGNVEVHELLYGEHGPRPLRNQPKSNNTERQWTIVPTMGFDEGGGSGGMHGMGPSTSTLSRVGNYELEELLGSGGMGDVYKARHTQFGRVRAVKVIKQQFVSAGHTEVIRRFYNEIKAVGRLEHRNIVVAIDSSSPHDDVHYLVMEYIEGVSLDELVAQQGPLPTADACEVIRQAARGLQYIHKHDMVHRDIKPSNLMITLVDGEHVQSDSTLTQGADGQRAIVKILDLGLALLADDGHDRLTRLDHKAMGTGMYMSPEQWKTSSVDIRADIYSLGCTLYHLLAGNPPYYDSDLRPEKAHEKSSLPMIRSGTQPVPKKLWDVLRKMLEKRPEDRYATPAEVAAALEPFVEGHALASLVRGHELGERTDLTARETMTGGASLIDTRRSRPWFSGLDIRKPSRRWMLGTALPLAVIMIAGGAMLYAINQGNEDRVRIAEQRTRDSLASFAKHAAREALPEEIAKRFELLTAAARSERLIEAVTVLNVDVPAGTPALEKLDPEALAALDEWIAQLAHRSGNEVIVDSWFVNNKYGVQVARSPKDKSIGQSYRHRDYFHGQRARDFDLEDIQDQAMLASVGPIDHNNMSLVYRSSTSGLLKVAFSVPIWNRPLEKSEEEVLNAMVADDRARAIPAATAAADPSAAPRPTETAATTTGATAAKTAASDAAATPAPAAPAAGGDAPDADAGGGAALPPRVVIGVLAMSVNVHEFKVLDEELAGGSEVVLIDLRADWIEGDEKHGLILHHPRLEKGKLARPDQELIDRINAANPNTDPSFDGKEHVIDGPGYADPLAVDKTQRYWGAFEPVRYDIGDVKVGPTDRVGWVVLVQTTTP